MSELYNKSLIKLELDQILKLLSECAGSELGKAACLRIIPSSDIEDVQQLLDETSAASEMCTRQGNPSFRGLKNISAALERAVMGGTLQPAELLDVACVFKATRVVKAYHDDDGENIHCNHISCV